MDTRRSAAYGHPQQCPHRQAGRSAQAKPSAPPAKPAQQAAPRDPSGRMYCAAYAKDMPLEAEAGEKAVLPLEPQRSAGGFAFSGGVAAVPQDCYYMILWELGVAEAEGSATLQLGINDAESQLTYALHEGYDSGQQITWLNAGDKLSLRIRAAEEAVKLRCSTAQFTIIRMG